MSNLSEKTVSELKVIAKEMKLTGYSKLRKAELISLIEENAVKEIKEETKTIVFSLNRHQRRRKEKIERLRASKMKVH